MGHKAESRISCTKVPFFLTHDLQGQPQSRDFSWTAKAGKGVLLSFTLRFALVSIVLFFFGFSFASFPYVQDTRRWTISLRISL
jgi:hypothetical protein